MKKFITLLLVLTGIVCTASATDYYIGAEISSSWSIQGQMTDEDGDGTYSLLVTLPTTGQEVMYFTIFTTNSITWDNAYRPNLEYTPWINNSIHEVEMLESNSNGYSICYPINNSGADNKNNARAIRISYTPSTKKLDVVRLIAVASGYNGWSTTTDYLEETSCGSKIYTGYVKLEAVSASFDNGFKFVYIDGGEQNYGGKNGDGYISNKGSNYEVAADGVYYLYAQFNDWTWTDPTLVTTTATVGARGFATFCYADYPLDFTGKSVKAYIVKTTDGSALTLTQVNKVAENTPLLLYSTTGSDSQIIPTTLDKGLDDVTGNKLVAGDGSAHTWTGEAKHYILYTGGENPGFYQANNSNVAVGKAYLDLTSLDTSARSFSLDFNDGETTAIANVSSKNEVLNNVFYNLNGQKIAQPTKGLYIMNGRKVVIK